MGGCCFSLFGGQPLLILGSIGPLVVFTGLLVNLIVIAFVWAGDAAEPIDFRTAEQRIVTMPYVGVTGEDGAPVIDPATGYNLAMTRHFFMDERRFYLLTYSRGSACWHGPLGLSPHLARPAALRYLLVSLSVILPSKAFSLREEFP